MIENEFITIVIGTDFQEIMNYIFGSLIIGHMRQLHGSDGKEAVRATDFEGWNYMGIDILKFEVGLSLIVFDSSSTDSFQTWLLFFISIGLFIRIINNNINCSLRPWPLLPQYLRVSNFYLRFLDLSYFLLWDVGNFGCNFRFWFFRIDFFLFYDLTYSRLSPILRTFWFLIFLQIVSAQLIDLPLLRLIKQMRILLVYSNLLLIKIVARIAVLVMPITVIKIELHLVLVPPRLTLTRKIKRSNALNHVWLAVIAVCAEASCWIFNGLIDILRVNRLRPRLNIRTLITIKWLITDDLD